MASMLLAPTSSAVGTGRKTPRYPKVLKAPTRVHKPARDVSLSVAAPTNWALRSHDDIIEEYYKCQILGQCGLGLQPNTPVAAIMVRDVVLTHPNCRLDEVHSQLSRISGMPVVDPKDNELIGVISRKDMVSTWTRDSLVKDVMSTPAVAIQAQHTIMEAACLMLKYKVHRLPVVDGEKRCIGIITQNDILAALGMFT